MKIAVAGGTGVVGAHVVDAVRNQGDEVVVLARSTGIDLTSGAGLVEALTDVDAVIDTTNAAAMSTERAIDFFRTVTRTLLAAEHDAGVGHHVALSIVGIDRSPRGYYAGKIAQEQEVAAGAVPWTIMRATQFHEFAAMMYEQSRVGPAHVVAKMRTQPVAAREVGARLAALAARTPAGRSAEFAGPREESLPEMVRAYSRAVGGPRWIPAVSLPGSSGRAQRDGSLLPSTHAVLGIQTFSDWVADVIRTRHTPGLLSGETTPAG